MPLSMKIRYYLHQKIKESNKNSWKPLLKNSLQERARNTKEQAIAGLLWSKQYYNYEVERWLLGDHKRNAHPQKETENLAETANGNVRNHDILLMAGQMGISLGLQAWVIPRFTFFSLALCRFPILPKNKLFVILPGMVHGAATDRFQLMKWNFSDVKSTLYRHGLSHRFYQMEKRDRVLEI